MSVNTEQARAGIHVKKTGQGRVRGSGGRAARVEQAGLLPRCFQPGRGAAGQQDAFPEAGPCLVPRPNGPAHCRKEAAALTAASCQGTAAAESGRGQRERTAAAFLTAGAGSTRSMGPQRRADLPREGWGRLRPPPERQKVLAKPGDGRVSGGHTRIRNIGLGGAWGRPGRAPGFRAPHRLLRAATAATAAILCRVCSLTRSLPSPRAR